MNSKEADVWGWRIMLLIVILLVGELLVANYGLRRTAMKLREELALRCPRPTLEDQYVVLNSKGECRTFSGSGSDSARPRRQGNRGVRL